MHDLKCLEANEAPDCCVMRASFILCLKQAEAGNSIDDQYDAAR